MNKIKQKGITLFVQNNFGKKIRYIYIDEPVKRIFFMDFHYRYMLLKGLAEQKIIKIDSDGKMQAMAQIFIHNPVYMEVPKSLRKSADLRDFMPVSMKIYFSGFKSKVLTYNDLKAIYDEIKNKKQPYSKNTDSFLQCGKARGMVLETQRGELASQSEFFKRFEVVFNQRNRENFIWLVNNWSILRAQEKVVYGKIQKINKEQTLVVEVKKQMEEILGEKFAGNVHHGLQHSLDLLERARELVALLEKETEVDWKVLAAAIYMHDIFAEDSELHGQKAADFIEKNFRGNDIFTEEQIEMIKQAVAFHDKKVSEDASDAVEDLNLETKILYDVDNLDAFGIKGIYRYFAAHISRGLAKQRSQAQVLAHIKQRVAYNVEQRRNNLYFKQSRQIADVEFPLTKMFFDKLVEEDYPVGIKKGATGVFTFIWENFQDMPWDIASKVEKHFVENDNDPLVSGEVAFVKVYFKRLQDVYAKAQAQWVQENKDSWGSSMATGTMKDMLELIEMAI